MPSEYSGERRARPASTNKQLQEMLSQLESRFEAVEKQVAALAAAGSGGTPPPLPPTSSLPDDERGRHELQLFFGQLHGLLDVIVSDDSGISLIPDEDRESLADAYGEIAAVFGRLQAQLNTGDYDQTLVEHGLADKQLFDKLRRWGRRLREFVADRTPQAARRALRPGGVIVGSVASMLPAWAAEPIKEFIQTVDGAVADQLQTRANRGL